MKHARTLAGTTALLATALLVPGVAAQSPSAAPAGSPDASMGTDTHQPHPAHVHSGTCTELGDVVAPLRDIAPVEGSATGAILSLPGVEASVTRLDLTIPQMLRDPHAINAHLSADQLDVYIACGEISGRRDDRNLVIPLQEQNASGYRGVSFLQEDGNRTIVFTVLFDTTGGSDLPTEPSPSMGVPTESLSPVESLAPALSPAASTAP